MMSRLRSFLVRCLVLVVFVRCGGLPEQDLEQSEEPLSAAEIALLSEDAKLWRQNGGLPRCGTWAIDEDYSSGRFNVHRWAIDLSPDGPTTVVFERTRGDWLPAILVGTRDGTLVYGGEQSSFGAGVSAGLIESGRDGGRAVVVLETDHSTSVDLYVTGFSALDSSFWAMLPRTARYTLSADQVCPPREGSEAWRDVADGLTQAGGEIPRRNLVNPTLERALGVSRERYGVVVNLEGYEFVEGTISQFGGPHDTGVSSTETGAITGERLRSLNDPIHPSEETLQNRPEDFYYAAMRFDYTGVGRGFWASARLLVVNPDTLAAVVVRPVDWGPNITTGRVIDLSPQALVDLGLDTDAAAAVSFAIPSAALGPH